MRSNLAIYGFILTEPSVWTKENAINYFESDRDHALIAHLEEFQTWMRFEQLTLLVRNFVE